MLLQGLARVMNTRSCGPRQDVGKIQGLLANDVT